MPLNIPTGSTTDISFGPARLYIGPSGTAPTVDVGYISEDGVTVEISSETKDIVQGNPKLIEYTFSQTQGVVLKVTSIEWDFENLVKALGAGVTTVTATESTFAFGGDPLVASVALQVEHQMAVSGNTMNIFMWKAVSESGINIPFGADEHSFEYSWKAQRATTNWAGVALPYNEQLVKFERLL